MARTREHEVILASVTIFTVVWYLLFLHPTTYFLFTSFTYNPSDLADEYSQIDDHQPLATMLLHVNVDDSNPFLPPLVSPRDKNIAVLTNKNFSHLLAKNRHAVVAFYSPNCRWSRRIVPKYAAAAGDLRGEPVLLAVVDASVETELLYKFGGGPYLTIFSFVDGAIHELYDYSSETTSDAIVSWVKTEIHGRVHTLMDKEEAAGILAGDLTSMKVLAILDSLEGPDSDELAAASNLQTFNTFYKTNNTEVVKALHIDQPVKSPALVILEKGNKSYFSFDGPFTRWAITNFLCQNEPPKLIKFTKETAPFLSRHLQDQLWLFAPKKEMETALASFKEVAKSFREKLLFVYVEMENGSDAETRISDDFGIARDETTVVLYLSINGAKKILKADLEWSGIKELAEASFNAQEFEQIEQDS